MTIAGRSKGKTEKVLIHRMRKVKNDNLTKNQNGGDVLRNWSKPVCHVLVEMLSLLDY